MKPIDAMESVFSELYERHIDTVYRVCYAMMGNKPDAEDAAQSVFVKLMRSNMDFRSVVHEKAWLITAARNHCRDEHRRWWRKKVVKLDAGMPNEQETGRLPQDDMMDYLRRLPPGHRLLLYLYYYEGYKLPEIAKMLGMNINTVKTRMRDARKRLKRELEEDFYMNRKRLRAVFDGMAPDDEQKIRMKRRIWEQVNLRSAQGRAAGGRWRWAAGSAAGLLLAAVMMINLPFGTSKPAYAISVKAGEDGAVFRFMDREGKQDGLVKSVSYVDPRPMLEFCIEGENIAKIHIKTENEYVYAVDWTKTQHEKYWNVEYYQHFDEATQTSVADFSLLYDKEMTMTFDEGFRDYDRIWYRWTAWNMYQWAAGDNFSRFYGYGYDPISIDFDRLTEEEKSELAAGSRSALGHMNLDEYPDHLQEDVITITITDRQGQVTTKAIRVRVDNNKLGQTVVTAELVDDPDSGQRR